MKELDVFIEGEVTDLCIPTEEFARESNWYSWFNNPSITRYLDQGLYPNTPDEQVDFFRSKGRDRLIFIISNKKEYIGTISLSFINLVRGTCDVALLIDGGRDIINAPFISLEAMALITDHAFSAMGMNRISAGQHIGLLSWQQRMELVGYQLEGLHPRKFIKGHEVADAVSLGCTYENYCRIVERRGALWDSCENMKARIRKLPKKSFASQMKALFEKERELYYLGLLDL